MAYVWNILGISLAYPGQLSLEDLECALNRQLASGVSLQNMLTVGKPIKSISCCLGMVCLYYASTCTSSTGL